MLSAEFPSCCGIGFGVCNHHAGRQPRKGPTDTHKSCGDCGRMIASLCPQSTPALLACHVGNTCSTSHHTCGHAHVYAQVTVIWCMPNAQVALTVQFSLCWTGTQSNILVHSSLACSGVWQGYTVLFCICHVATSLVMVVSDRHRAQTGYQTSWIRSILTALVVW